MELLISLASNTEDKHKLQLVHRALVNNDRLTALSHLSCMVGAINNIREGDYVLVYTIAMIVLAGIYVSGYLLMIAVVPIAYLLNRKPTHIDTIKRIIEELPNADISTAELNGLEDALY